MHWWKHINVDWKQLISIASGASKFVELATKKLDRHREEKQNIKNQINYFEREAILPTMLGVIFAAAYAGIPSIINQEFKATPEFKCLYLACGFVILWQGVKTLMAISIVSSKKAKLLALSSKQEKK